MSIVKLIDIKKIYNDDSVDTVALNGISLDINSGEMVAIMGPSGSGKSTLLNIIGFIDGITEGKYYFKDELSSNICNGKLSRIRNENFGFIFQHFGLVKEYTVLENVMLPLNIRKLSKKYKVEQALLYLKKVGLDEYVSKKSTKLSGGQQQRVAIARALAQETGIIIADEPTGALDQQTGKEIMEMFKELNREGKTIIIVTHDENVASYCNRKIIMKDGKVVDDYCKSRLIDEV